jgi:tetratricopeptide (TPR) repeat protein
LKLSQQAVDDARKFHGATSYVTEFALTNLFFAYGPGRDRTAALAAIREAYEISVKRELSGSGNRTRNKMLMIHLLFEMDKYDEIERVMQESPPVMKLVPGSPANAPTETPIHYHLYEAQMRLQLGESGTAERLAEEAVQSMEAEGAQIIGWRIYAVLAAALHQNGKLERAESFAIAALENDGVEFAPTARRNADHHLGLSLIRLDLAKYQIALEDAEKASALLSEAGELGADDLARVNFRRGRSFLGLGRHSEAIGALSAAHAHWQRTESASEAEALTAYWYGQALIATGEAARGRALVTAASPHLAASRRLVADSGKPK